jgi:Protein of unknown function (DUF3313)
MKTISSIIIATLLGLAGCSPTPTVIGPTNDQGLAEIKHNSFEQLLIRPDTNFKQYHKIIIEPITVTYSDQKHYDNLNRGEKAFQLDQRELEKFNQQFIKAFSSKWQDSFAWKLTDQKGEDVIIVKAAISDFYLYASIKNDKILPHYAATRDSSKMIIHLSLLDSISGEVLLDSRGKKVIGRNTTGSSDLTPVSSVRYWHDSYQGFRQWASLLGRHIGGL